MKNPDLIKEENDMLITHHAKVRMQQRGIDSAVLNYLDDYGRFLEQGNKGSIVYFDKQSKTRLRKNLARREYIRIERKLRAYFVISNDGVVVTVGHRNKPIHH